MVPARLATAAKSTSVPRYERLVASAKNMAGPVLARVSTHAMSTLLTRITSYPGT